MPAEAHDEARGTLRDEIEAVPEMEARNRAPGAAQHRPAAFLRRREANHRAVHALLEPRGEDADYALVPTGIEEGQAGVLDRFQMFEGLVQHRCLDRPALGIEPIELLREVHGPGFVVGNQAFDADTHVGEPARGVEARPGDETEVEARRLGRRASRRAQERHYAGLAASGAQAL